jgi:hypothetical protein
MTAERHERILKAYGFDAAIHGAEEYADADFTSSAELRGRDLGRT